MAYNVLIVDDSASMRSIIAKSLRLSGVALGEVHMAGDGVEALEVLEEAWIDIVLADLNMPNMGGIELIERLQHKGMTASVPVVVVSTEVRRDVIQSLLALGAAAFLRKPFAPEQLGQLIESVLSNDAQPPQASLLNAAFFEALEGFAMLVGDVVAEPTEPPNEALVARVAFVGPGTAGEVIVAACPSTCSTIARSATGEDEGDAADALAELANMTAGQLVDRIPGGPFVLHPPAGSTSEGGAAWELVGSIPTRAVFDVEGRTVLAGVEVRKRW